MQYISNCEREDQRGQTDCHPCFQASREQSCWLRLRHRLRFVALLPRRALSYSATVDVIRRLHSLTFQLFKRNGGPFFWTHAYVLRVCTNFHSPAPAAPPRQVSFSFIPTPAQYSFWPTPTCTPLQLNPSPGPRQLNSTPLHSTPPPSAPARHTASVISSRKCV